MSNMSFECKGSHAKDVGGSALAPWYRDLPANSWRVLALAGLGWLFEVCAIIILSLTLPALITVFGLSRGDAGLIASASVIGLTTGGIVFGWIADRIGRVRTLTLAILIYSVLTFPTAFAPDAIWVAVLRFLGGLGMGGAWTAGAALVAETWGAKHRGKGGALMQMGLPFGSLLAVGVVLLVAHFGGQLEGGSWRWVYGLGILPIIILYPVARITPESPVWLARSRVGGSQVNIRDLFHGRNLIGLSKAFAFIFFCQYIYWAVFTWTPTFLVSVKHLDFVRSMGFTVAQHCGSIVGFVCFALLVDRIGRRPTFSVYLLIGALAVIGSVWMDEPLQLMATIFFTGVGVTGLFAGLGPFAAEMVPETSARGFAMGLAYNGGRLGGLLAPHLVGALATGTTGFQMGMLTTVAAFVLAFFVVLASPETKGVELS